MSLDPSTPSAPPAAEAYQLVQLANGTYSVHSVLEDETFHPVIGPVAEAQALYVGQTRFRERLASMGSDRFVVWDVGLGAAANVATLLAAGADTESTLEILSFDKTPEPAWFALRHARELGYPGPWTTPLECLLENSKPGAEPGSVEFLNGRQRVRWSLHLGDFPTLLAARPVLAPPHLVLFDAFSPATNPEMWTLRVFQDLHAALSLSHGCLLPTYSRSTLLRVTLLVAGFFVGRGHATGEKEETTIASNHAALIDQPLERAWLERVRRSTSAEPLHTPVYRQQPLQPETWAALSAHPQFQ